MCRVHTRCIRSNRCRLVLVVEWLVAFFAVVAVLHRFGMVVRALLFALDERIA